MPEEKLWETFFKPEDILLKMGMFLKVKDAADFGSGYGIFTIPAAKIVSGKVYAVDVEKQLLDLLENKAKRFRLKNIKTLHRDIDSEGCGLESESMDYVMLFNILHGNRQGKIIKEAYRILKTNGTAGIIHWNYDPATPRGPPMELRLKPEEIIKKAEDTGFKLKARHDLKPYHYGLVMTKIYHGVY